MEAAPSPLTDLHSHILPGVDDGARDLAEAVAMAHAALADGITTLAATPHSLDCLGKITPAELEAGVAELERCLQAQGLPLRVAVGSEVALIAGLPRQIDAGLVVSLNHSRYLMLESPFEDAPSQIDDLIFQAQVRGYVPLLAHPERSPALAGHLDRVRALVERGALVQITAGSLEGLFGRSAQVAAERLLAAGLVHVIASDAHDARRRPPRLSKAEALAARIVGRERARALVADNPAAILAGEALRVELPQPPPRRRWSI